MSRLLADSDYKALFAAAYPEAKDGFAIEHLANAIAAYEAVTWRADKSPFDNYVRGDKNALSPEQKRGADYFYGKGKCASCHSGPLQTDHGHHAVGVVQFGPGTGVGSQGWDDYGYGTVSGDANDNYKFRTPSLRNTAVTGPWGHNGAYTSLRDFVALYKNPTLAYDHWDAKQVILPKGTRLTKDVLGAWNDNGVRSAIKSANEATIIDLSADEIDAIVLFLQALTDPNVAQNTQAIFKY
jgi:cytochrome c peroxidase